MHAKVQGTCVRPWVLHDLKQVRSYQYRPDFCPMSGWLLGRPLVDPGEALERTRLKGRPGRLGVACRCECKRASWWCSIGLETFIDCHSG